MGAKSNGGKQGMADALAEMTKRYADHGFKLRLRLRFKLLYRGKM
jgi:hypothetical protein